MPRGTGEVRRVSSSPPPVDFWSGKGDRRVNKHSVYVTCAEMKVVQGVEIMPGGSNLHGSLAPRRCSGVCTSSEHGNPCLPTCTRQAGLCLYERTVCLVVLSDLLSFPVRVLTQAGALLESSRALPGRGREGSFASGSWGAQTSSAFF